MAKPVPQQIPLYKSANAAVQCAEWHSCATAIACLGGDSLDLSTVIGRGHQSFSTTPFDLGDRQAKCAGWSVRRRAIL